MSTFSDLLTGDLYNRYIDIEATRHEYRTRSRNDNATNSISYTNDSKVTSTYQEPGSEIYGPCDFTGIDTSQYPYTYENHSSYPYSYVEQQGTISDHPHAKGGETNCYIYDIKNMGFSPYTILHEYIGKIGTDYYGNCGYNYIKTSKIEGAYWMTNGAGAPQMSATISESQILQGLLARIAGQVDAISQTLDSLKEIPRTLKMCKDYLSILTFDYVKASKRAGETAYQRTLHPLQYYFAIEPMPPQIQDFIDRLQNAKLSNTMGTTEQYVRLRATEEMKETRTETTEGPAYDYGIDNVKISRTYTITRKFTYKAYVKMPSFHEFWKKDLANLFRPSQIWDTIRQTWFIDSFCRVGAILQASEIEQGMLGLSVGKGYVNKVTYSTVDEVCVLTFKEWKQDHYETKDWQTSYYRGKYISRTSHPMGIYDIIGQIAINIGAETLRLVNPTTIALAASQYIPGVEV